MRLRVGSGAILAALVCAYPLAVLARGAPHFPSRSDCAHPAARGDKVEAVFGRFENRDAAEQLLRRAQKVGYASAVAVNDGCGSLKVVVAGVPNVDVGRALVAEAHTVGLRPVLERATP